MLSLPSDKNYQKNCNDIIPVDNKGDNIYIISKSLLDNTLEYLLEKNLLITELNTNDWKIKYFYYTVRDFLFILP
jgi:hypothetical protein